LVKPLEEQRNCRRWCEKADIARDRQGVKTLGKAMCKCRH